MKHPYIPKGCDQQGRIDIEKYRSMRNMTPEELGRHFGYRICHKAPEPVDPRDIQNAQWLPAESCTEIGSEPTGRHRMGAFRGWERFLVERSKRPGFWVVLCVVVAVAGYIVQASK